MPLINSIVFIDVNLKGFIPFLLESCSCSIQKYVPSPHHLNFTLVSGGMYEGIEIITARENAKKKHECELVWVEGMSSPIFLCINMIRPTTNILFDRKHIVVWVRQISQCHLMCKVDYFILLVLKLLTWSIHCDRFMINGKTCSHITIKGK